MVKRISMRVMYQLQKTSCIYITVTVTMAVCILLI